MAAQSYLIFGLRGARYAMDISVIHETLWLPELTPVEEAPDPIAGLLNLRGEIVPVIDLERRFGYASRKFLRSDKVIVFDHEARTMGIVVESLHDVVELDPGQIREVPDYGMAGPSDGHFVSGVAKVLGGLVSLINLDALVGDPVVDLTTPGDSRRLPSPNREFYPEGESETRHIFETRAAGYRQCGVVQDAQNLLALAVVRLGGEDLAIEMKGIVEFIDIRSITPVPRSPDHIAGLMNFRGEVITVLNIAASHHPTANRVQSKKAAVLRLDGGLAAVLLDDVLDVLYVSPGDLGPVPSGLLSESHTHLRGTLSYGGKLLSVSDLPQVLNGEDWSVQK